MHVAYHHHHVYYDRDNVHIHIMFLFCVSCLGVPPTMVMSDVFKKFGLDSNTADFTGHAVALYRDDE